MQILVVASNFKPLGCQKAKELCAWLGKLGYSTQLVMAEDVEIGGRFSKGGLEPGFEPKLILSLGGDGTMLTSAQLAFHHPAPILGFNFGTLGYLTGATADVVDEGVQAAIDGKLESESRCALDVEIVDENGGTTMYTVLNEVSLSRGAMGKMFRYEVRIDDEHLTNMFADGVLVSSPTGSTAYSLSAGGPILSPALSCMIVVAVAPHSLVTRALVTGEKETVHLIPEDDPERNCMIFLDGHSIDIGRLPKRVSVRVRPDAVTLLKYNSPSFTKSVSKVFYGGWDD